jgi:hypothetical protein
MKLPVFRAIGATFGFLASRWLDILKIVWLPAALTCAVNLLIMPVYMNQVAAATLDGAAAGGATGGPQQMIDQTLATLPILAVLAFASALVNALLFSGLMKLMIRNETPKLPVYFAAGADELRLLGSWGVMLLGAVGVALGVWAALWLSRLLASMGPGPGAIIGLVAACGVIGVGVWLAVRMSLVAPAVIAHRRLGIEPSWTITEENAWRLIGFWLLWIVPFFIIASLLTPVLSAPGYLEATRDIYAAARSPARMQAAIQHAYEIQAAGYQLTNGGNIARMIASSLLGVGATTLLAIAGGAAWRLLTEEEADRA